MAFLLTLPLNSPTLLRYSDLYTLTDICIRNGQCSTTKLLEYIGSLHDVESLSLFLSRQHVSKFIFATHWGHLAIIFLWLSGSLFHIGWSGNFSAWVLNPLSILPVAHAIWDPHFFLFVSFSLSSTPSYAGIYNWLLGVGFTSTHQIYITSLSCDFLALSPLLSGKLHSTFSLQITHFSSNASHSAASPYLTFTTSTLSALHLDSTKMRLNFHVGSLTGASSTFWSGHLVHAAILVSRGASPILLLPTLSTRLLNTLSSGFWHSLSSLLDSLSHAFGTYEGSGNSLLTFFGTLNSSSTSLFTSDMAHHHLALGILLLWASHFHASLRRSFSSLFTTSSSSYLSPLSVSTCELSTTSGILSTLSNLVRSFHFQLSLALGSLSALTFFTSYQMWYLPGYPYLTFDIITSTSIFVHHNWIASFFLIGSFAHFSIFLIRDYTPVEAYINIFSRLLVHKSSLVSHLSWVSLFLGLHTLGVYVHNDSTTTFGSSHKQLLLEPALLQSTSRLFSASNFQPLHDSTHFSLISGLNLSFTSGYTLSLLGPGDFLATHAYTLGLHVTSLILLKGALDARGSSLLPDKSQFGFSFACDGPARGGTCDISSWDAFYLAFFWLLNSNSWSMFYTHWRHLLFWASLGGRFDESSTYLNGWFRDYLWFNSSSLIRGYDPLGIGNISAWAWSFLLSHLCWAVGFMFFISWRGYWQELIDSISYMHLKTPFLFLLWDGDFYTPSALSILQARFVGLVHFTSGLIMTYAAFVLGATT